MLFFKRYYKIVRSIQYRTFTGNIEIKHSCWIPYGNKFSVQYEKGKWTTGDDLFVFEYDNIDILKNLVQSICLSYSVVDSISEDSDYSNYVKTELWECMIGQYNSINNIHHIKPVHLFLKDPEFGKNRLREAKESDAIINVKPKQIVTDKIKLTDKVYTYIEDKIILYSMKG